MKFNTYNTSEEVVVTKEVKRYCFEFTEEEAEALAKIHGGLEYTFLDPIKGGRALSYDIWQNVKHLHPAFK